MSSSSADDPIVRRLAVFIRKHPQWALAVFCAVLYLPGLGNHDLWNPDEPRYAEVTREMLTNGRIFVPHLNGEVYTHKPPAMFWAMGLASVLVGDLTETAVRLPSALAAIGAVLLTHKIGSRLFGARAGLVAALALATSTKVLWQARTGQIDMLLTFLVTLTAYLWVRGWLENRQTLYLWGFLVAGVGTITKGPVALLPILLSFLIFFRLAGERGEIARMRIGRGLLLWLAVVLAWLVPASLEAGSSYFQELVVTQNVTRATAGEEYVGTRGHIHPWYYYLTMAPVEFLPWSLLIPGALLALRRSADRQERRAATLAGSWALVTIVFFSLSAAKRSVYILQMYPALALLVGAGIAVAARSGRLSSRWVTVPLVAFSVILGSIAVAIAVVGPSRPEVELLRASLPYELAAVVALVALSGITAARIATRRRILAAVVCLAGGFGLSVLTVTWGLLPAADPLKSVRPIAQRYLELSETDEPYGFYPEEEPALQFYTGRLGEALHDEEDVHDFLARGRSTGRVWLFAERDDLRRLERPVRAREVARGVDPDNGYVLFVADGSRPAGSEP